MAAILSRPQCVNSSTDVVVRFSLCYFIAWGALGAKKLMPFRSHVLFCGFHVLLKFFKFEIHMYDQTMCFSICYCLPRRIIHRRINAILERLYYLSQEMVCHLSAKISLRQIYLFVLLNVQWMAACHGASAYSVPSCQQGDESCNGV